MADVTLLSHACYLREVERAVRRRHRLRPSGGALLTCLVLAAALALA
jgi:hypothetical protein